MFTVCVIWYMYIDIVSSESVKWYFIICIIPRHQVFLLMVLQDVQLPQSEIQMMILDVFCYRLDPQMKTGVWWIFKLRFMDCITKTTENVNDLAFLVYFFLA